jgi:D-arabinose 1-dehydrogenase-like Zn-dependent alcohol dehydrogenase
MSAPIKTVGIATAAADAKLGPWEFSRHAPGPDDVVIDIKYCGVCHSDLHTGEQDRHAILLHSMGCRYLFGFLLIRMIV